MDAHTVELYSEQGNTDITDLVVINKTAQCGNCKECNAFCTCGVIVQELSAAHTKTLKDIMAQVMIRLRGLQWEVSTRGTFVKKVKNAKSRSIIPKSNEEFRRLCRWNNDADCRWCLQENSRRYETMTSWDKVAGVPRKIPE